MLRVQLGKKFCQLQEKFYIALLTLAMSCSLLQSAPLTGLVVGPDRRPLANVQIDFVPARAEFQLPQDLTPKASVLSKDDGTFMVPVDPSDDLCIIAYAPGYRRARFPFVDIPKPFVKIGITLERGEKIEGVVLDAQTAAPIAGAEIGPVVLSPDEEISLSKKHVPVWTTSTVNGRFVIDGLLPKHAFQFLVRKDGYQLANVQARAGTPNVVVRLENGGSEVGGVVRSPSQPPAQFAGTRIWLNGNGFSYYQCADEQGHFHYRGLPAGNFSLEAIVAHPRVSRVALLEFPRDHGKEVELLVSDGYWLEGTTYDATTSAPVAGVVLRVEDKVTTSGAGGRFRVGPLWLVGWPTIEVLDESGFVSAQPPAGALVVHNEADGFRDLLDETVWVRPVRKLLLNVDGLELTTQPVQIVFVPVEGPRLAERVTSAAYALRLRSEKAGVIWCTDHATWATPYRYLPPAGAKHDLLRLRLEPAGSLRGHVRREGLGAGTSATLCTVRLYAKIPSADKAPIVLETNTDEKGAFRFPCVPMGAYRVVATAAKGNIEKATELEIHPASHYQLDFLLPAGKRFAGKVRDSKEQPVGGVAVRYYVRETDGSTKAGMVETNADGQFSVEELDGEALSFVQVERKGYVTWQKRDIPLPCENLEIVLTPETALPFVVNGSPSELWQVYLMRLDVWGSGTYANQLVGREVASTRVVGGNQDAFPSPAPGRYRIVACDNTRELVGVSPEIEWDPAQGVSAPVVVTPGKTGRLKIEFENAHVENGELVATNMIVPESIAAAERRVPDVTGDSTELDSLIPGDYLITITSSSFNSSATNVRVEPDRPATVKLKALQLGAVEGRVLNGKTPVQGVQVTLKSQTDPSFEPKVMKTDADGQFRVEGLPPDLYVVEVMLANEGGTTKQFRKSAKVTGEGGTANVEINIAPPPRLSFALPTSFNVAPGSQVILLSRDSGETVRPEWKGDLLEAEVEPGVYTVSVGDAPVGTMRLQADGRTEALE